MFSKYMEHNLIWGTWWKLYHRKRCLYHGKQVFCDIYLTFHCYCIWVELIIEKCHCLKNKSFSFFAVLKMYKKWNTNCKHTIRRLWKTILLYLELWWRDGLLENPKSIVFEIKCSDQEETYVDPDLAPISGTILWHRCVSWSGSTHVKRDKALIYVVKG
jgi:hypothetical protein